MARMLQKVVGLYLEDQVRKGVLEYDDEAEGGYSLKGTVAKRAAQRGSAASAQPGDVTGNKALSGTHYSGTTPQLGGRSGSAGRYVQGGTVLSRRRAKPGTRRGGKTILG